MKITKTDYLIIIILCILPLLFITVRNSGYKKLYLVASGSKMEIPLTPDYWELKNGAGIEITEEGARFTKNTCLNQTCVKAGWVTDCGDTAVCVPNKIALVMECSEAETEYDAISQ